MDRSAKTLFNFVNLSHPDELKSPNTQLRIRRLAMTEVGKARRKPKTKRGRNEIVLEFRDPAASLSASDPLVGGEVDPFTRYPVDMDENSRSLVAFIFRNNSAHSRQLRGSWWLVGIADSAAFNNVLANAHLFLLKELTGSFARQDDTLSLSHQNTAFRLVREKMKDPKQHDSDELLAAIMSFMCHHHTLGVFAGWDHHRNAMARILELRGGADAITKEGFRVTLSWSDLIGSFAQDRPSIVPLPIIWQADSKSPPGSPRFLSALSLHWKRQFPMELEWITIFDDLSQLIALERAFTHDEVKGALTTGCWVEPTMVRLLAIRPLSRGSERCHVIEEVCRLGTLLFLAPIWRWFGASPVWTFTISANLLAVLKGHMVEWDELKPLLAWAVYFAAIETSDSQERNQFVFILAVLMGGWQMQQWDELMDVVRGVLWVDRIHASSDDGIREDVLGFLQTPTGYISPLAEVVDDA